jgi:hypothetical protein
MIVYVQVAAGLGGFLGSLDLVRSRFGNVLFNFEFAVLTRFLDGLVCVGLHCSRSY